MKKIIYFSLVFFLVISQGYAVPKLQVAVVCQSAELYTSALALLSKNENLVAVERRDLSGVLHEMELSQTGIIDLPEQKLQNVEFLLQMEENKSLVSGRIVRVHNGRILGAWQGTIEDVIQGVNSRLDAEVALKNLAELKQTKESIRFKTTTGNANPLTGKNILKYGEKLELYLNLPPVDGYLYILGLISDGDILV
jgi:hypothetical protein